MLHLTDDYLRHCAVLGSVILGLLASWPGCSRRSGLNREVWAEVNGKPIYRDEVERYYRTRIAAASEGGGKEQLNIKLNILNQLIDDRILLTHAIQSRIAVSEGEVDAKIGQIRSPYSHEEFEKKLKDQDLTLDDLRQEVRQSLLMQKLINKEITSRLTVSPAEIAEYYQQNRSNFNVPETRYHLAQILVTPVRDRQVQNLKNDDAKSGAAAFQKVKAIYKRLRAGEDFAKVAEEYSEDPRTALGGGDMGFVPASSLATDADLRKGLNGLKVGQISGILRDNHGNYHILKVLGRENAGQRDLSDAQVQNTIRQTLIDQKEQLLKAAYIEELRNKAKVVDRLAEQIVRGGVDPARIK